MTYKFIFLLLIFEIVWKLKETANNSVFSENNFQQYEINIEEIRKFLGKWCILQVKSRNKRNWTKAIGWSSITEITDNRRSTICTCIFWAENSSSGHQDKQFQIYFQFLFLSIMFKLHQTSLIFYNKAKRYYQIFKKITRYIN